MTARRLRLGQLLVDAGMITQDALDEVLAVQQTDGRRLGAILVERKLVNETQLTQILSHQLSIPWVSLLHIEFSRQLLNLVPRDVAERFGLLPIYVRRPRGGQTTLYVAMDDPLNEEALSAVSEFAGLPVRPMIAPPGDIRAAIRVYYGAPDSSVAPPETTRKDPRRAETLVSAQAVPVAPVEVEIREEAAPPTAPTPAPRSEPPTIRQGRGASQPPPSGPADPPDAGPSNEAETTAPAAAPEGAEPAQEVVVDLTQRRATPLPSEPAPTVASDTSAIDSGDRISSVPAPIPAPRARKGPRMVSLTLLDGTTLSLPARPTKTGAEHTAKTVAEAVTSAAPPSEREADGRDAALAPTSAPASAATDSELTARDLVAALRAVLQGADASEVLGDDARWEAMFGALLSLLLRKHLIADWEFVAELKRMHGEKKP